MRGLTDYIRRRGRDCADAIAAACQLPPARRSRKRDGAGRGASAADLAKLSGEIQTVSNYVARLKGEIAALRPNEIYKERLPLARTDLAGIKEASASGANTIMAAAEAILNLDAADPASYRSAVEEKVLEIFEACSFQDIAGQRVARILEALGPVETRMQRFALAVKASDATGQFDRASIMREARREVLIVEGPQDSAEAVDQSAIDRLFD